MSRKEVVVVTCDKCGKKLAGDDLHTFTITYAAETREVDLCTDDASPLLKLVKGIGKRVKTKPSKAAAKTSCG